MEKHEIEEEASERSRPPPWLSGANILLTVITVLVSVGASLTTAALRYGSVEKQVEINTQRLDVGEQQLRGITPGAAEQIAAIRATDQGMQQQINALREDVRASRTEMTSALRDLTIELRRHDSETRR